MPSPCRGTLQQSVTGATWRIREETTVSTKTNRLVGELCAEFAAGPGTLMRHPATVAADPITR